MPYEEEEDRVCEVKCPKGGGGCGYGATPILLLKIICNTPIGVLQILFCIDNY